MADLQRDIDWIGREVLRRLQDRLAAAPAAGVGPSAPAGSSTAPASPVPQSGSNAGTGRELVVSDRVVTLAALQNRLDGIHRVLVPAGSLVTPAVCDELRKRQITLVRGGLSAAVAQPNLSLLVGVAQVASEPTALANTACAELGPVNCVAGGCVLDVVRRLADALLAQRCCAVLLTSRPAVALCAANRRRGVRAAWGWNPAAAVEATKAIGANLLVVDPAAQSVFQLRRMIREFVHGGRAECPAEYRALFEETGS
jgi:hypothetical protein